MSEVRDPTITIPNELEAIIHSSLNTEKSKDTKRGDVVGKRVFITLVISLLPGLPFHDLNTYDETDPLRKLHQLKFVREERLVCRVKCLAGTCESTQVHGLGDT